VIEYGVESYKFSILTQTYTTYKLIVSSNLSLKESFQTPTGCIGHWAVTNGNSFNTVHTSEERQWDGSSIEHNSVYPWSVFSLKCKSPWKPNSLCGKRWQTKPSSLWFNYIEKTNTLSKLV